MKTLLVTNDDGIDARGLHELVNLFVPMYKIVIVAPATAHSGMSNAITTSAPLRLEKKNETDRMTWYECSGTPTDCVKLAIHELKIKADILLSGINHGANTSVSVLYSGTVGAAIEGCLQGLPSIAFSVGDFSKECNFKKSLPFVSSIVEKVIAHGLPDKTLLNINFPKGDVKGIWTVRQAQGHWEERFDKREDPFQRPYYWLTGDFHNEDMAEDHTDATALEQGYAAIVPVKVDMTHYEAMDYITKLFS